MLNTYNCCTLRKYPPCNPKYCLSVPVRASVSLRAVSKNKGKTSPESAGEELRVRLSVLVKRRSSDSVDPEAKIVAKHGVVALPRLPEGRRSGGGEGKAKTNAR